MYDYLTHFLKEKDLRVERAMFAALLYNLQLRDAGNTTQASNLMAYATKLHQVSDGFKINDGNFKQMSKLAAEAWKNK